MGIRRVVAGINKTGKAVIQYDADATNVTQATNNIKTTLLWVTDQAPTNNEGNEDSANQEIGIPPPPMGSIFRIVEFTPEGSDGGSDEYKYLSSVRAEENECARHPGMHKTNSIDYAIIMSGEIDMLVDDDEVHLKAGDVIVQRGNNHAWANRGTNPYSIKFILIDSDPV